MSYKFSCRYTAPILVFHNIFLLFNILFVHGKMTTLYLMIKIVQMKSNSNHRKVDNPSATITNRTSKEDLDFTVKAVASRGYIQIHIIIVLSLAVTLFSLIVFIKPLSLDIREIAYISRCYNKKKSYNVRYVIICIVVAAECNDRLFSSK